MSDGPAPTNINAYRAELSEAEVAVTQAQGRVNSLKETIKAMEAADTSAPTAEPTVQATAPVTPSDPVQDDADQAIADLEKLKRDELEARAADAGVVNPEEAANKHELAQATVEASTQRDDGETQEAIPSHPITDTPESSDMPPASSEVPAAAQPENPGADAAPANNPERPIGSDQAPDVPTDSGSDQAEPSPVV